MKIYDISQEVISCEVYPGDESPEMIADKRIDDGEVYNLTSIKMCTHNGTHMDSPFHFINDGKTIDQIPLGKTIGYGYVFSHNGIMTANEALEILEKVKAENQEAAKRILIKGHSIISTEAAEVFASEKIYLIGVESQSVGPTDAPMAVHKVLLAEEVVLLEGLRLNEVNDGMYFLCAQPINLAGSDGAPCRAVLIESQVIL